MWVIWGRKCTKSLVFDLFPLCLHAWFVSHGDSFNVHKFRGDIIMQGVKVHAKKGVDKKAKLSPTLHYTHFLA